MYHLQAEKIEEPFIPDDIYNQPLNRLLRTLEKLNCLSEGDKAELKRLLSDENTNLVLSSRVRLTDIILSIAITADSFGYQLGYDCGHEAGMRESQGALGTGFWPKP